MATYWVKTSTAPSSARTVPSSSSSRSSFSDRPRQPAARLLEEVGGVVADLLEPGEQREHQPAPGLLVGALDPVHRVAHERLVEHDLLAGEPRAGGRSRSWRAAPARCRGRTCGGAAGTGRSAPGTAPPCSAPARTRSGAAHTLRNALRLPSRPGVAQSRIDQSSVRLFSTGVPVSATRARLGIDRSARAVEERAFLTCWASSATTRSQSTSASAAWSRRMVPYVVSTKPEVATSASERRPPWNRRTGTPGANRADLVLPVAEQRRRADHEGRAGRAGLDPVQVERDQGDRLAEAHVVGQAGAQPERRSARRAR